MNSLILVGRLTKDPELRYIPGTGTAVATFSIAVDRDYTKKDGSRDTDFIPVEVMGKPAEFCANYLSKGRLISIQGSMRVDNYQDQSGERKTFTKCAAKFVNALDKANKEGNDFKPQGLEPQGFQAIDTDDIPF
ncbi:single-stranded DNA-binding protein (plasmid) [Paraclostridium ghonii]|uniref:single-stranded DNA-binding protein n=1 Tax=Paraclostridium ghonii TaxID=29358 RepID=UPI00202D05C4|nr:single-stranded DNA-binding protein [Paeniclostridium ghonii]MCM0167617.1 single-stranded DNA-binding protein [Paeniclostridium ghonii]